MKFLSLLLILSLLCPEYTYSQCSIFFTPSQNQLACSNDSVTLTAYGSFSAIQGGFDFNSGAPAGWNFVGTAAFGQFCGSSNDGTDYYWASTATNGFPLIETEAYNLTCADIIAFDFRFGLQGAPTPCDGPNDYDEGVELSYSIDNGSTWIPFAYLNPTGTIDPSLADAVYQPPLTTNQVTIFTTWDNYYFQLPPAALTPSTKLRWLQSASSGVNFDNWGIDNLLIYNSNCPNNTVYNWSNGTTNNQSITVASSQDTSYIVYVYDSLGVFQCQDTCYLTINQDLGFDNSVQLISTKFRPGTTSVIKVDGYNDGCTVTSGEITIVLDSIVSFLYATTPPDFISGDTLRWNYSGLYFGSPHFKTDIIVETDSLASFNNDVNISVRIDSIFGDYDIANNVKDYTFPIFSSYDPNDKQVYPIGDCVPGYISDDQKLTYTIRFQNTGNAPANNVFIIDTISSFLDINSLNVVCSSDPMETEFLTPNTVKFNFENIQLPDSLSDPLGSIGYVVFEIDQLPANAVGSEITNNVDIYFDFNAPVRTNTVLNTISDSSYMFSFDTVEVTALDSFVWNNITYDQSGIYQFNYFNTSGCDSIVWLDLTIETNQSGLLTFLNEQLSIVPNPSSGAIKLIGLSEPVEISVFNNLGQHVYSTHYLPGKEVDLSQLISGMYTLHIFYNDYRISKSVVLSK